MTDSTDFAYGAGLAALGREGALEFLHTVVEKGPDHKIA